MPDESKVSPADMDRQDAEFWALREIMDALALVPAERRYAVTASALVLLAAKCRVAFDDSPEATLTPGTEAAPGGP